MKNMQHLLIVPLLVLTGLALSACGGSVPFNFPAEAGIEEIIDGFEADELEFIGIVQEIGEEAWTISDLEIRIVEETEIDDEIVVGDFVEVEALQFGDGTLIAEEIEPFDNDRDVDDDGNDDLDDDDYDFSGIVQVIADNAWIIDGHVVAITADTEIDDDITVGDAVEVEAQVEEDGSLSVLEIELADDDLDADSDVDSDDDIEDNENDVDDDVEDVDDDDNNEDDVDEDDDDEDDDDDDDNDDDADGDDEDANDEND